MNHAKHTNTKSRKPVEADFQKPQTRNNRRSNFGISFVCCLLFVPALFAREWQYSGITAPRYSCGASGCENREVKLPSAKIHGGSFTIGSGSRISESQPNDYQSQRGGNENSRGAGAVDLDRLSRAVAIAETGDCTRGVGITHNNCFGIRERGKFVKFDTVAASYASFKWNWRKSYGGFPTLADAIRWTGGDRSKIWLENVTRFYVTM